MLSAVGGRFAPSSDVRVVARRLPEPPFDATKIGDDPLKYHARKVSNACLSFAHLDRHPRHVVERNAAARRFFGIE